MLVRFLNWLLGLFGVRRLVVYRNPDGTHHGTCPRCKARVAFNPQEIGKPAFRCDVCGESGKWTEPPQRDRFQP